MNCVVSMIDHVLESEILKIQSNEHENSLLSAKKCCEYMRCTINNLVDLRNLQKGDFQAEFEEFEPRTLVADCYQLFEQ